jgi:hypothetical protein
MAKDPDELTPEEIEELEGLYHQTFLFEKEGCDLVGYIQFVPFESEEQRDEAYTNWVKCYLQSVRNT